MASSAKQRSWLGVDFRSFISKANGGRKYLTSGYIHGARVEAEIEHH